jgi:hypothetical protein
MAHFEPFLLQSGNGTLFGLFWYFLNGVSGNPGPIHSRIRKFRVLYSGAVARKYQSSDILAILSVLHAPCQDTRLIIVKNRKSGYISDFVLKKPVVQDQF